MMRDRESFNNCTHSRATHSNGSVNGKVPAVSRDGSIPQVRNTTIDKHAAT